MKKNHHGKSTLLLLIGVIIGGLVVPYFSAPLPAKQSAEFTENIYWQKFFYESVNAFMDSSSERIPLSDLAPSYWDEACVYLPYISTVEPKTSDYKIITGSPAQQNDTWAILFKNNKKKTAWYVQNPNDFSRTKMTKANQCFDRSVSVRKITENVGHSRYSRIYLQ